MTASLWDGGIPLGGTRGEAETRERRLLSDVDRRTFLFKIRQQRTMSAR
jgi:hypothetical protein